MKPDTFEYVLYRMHNTPIRKYPYPHIYVENIFPTEVYKKILENLPNGDLYTPIDSLGKTKQGQYHNRHLFLLPQALDKLQGEKREFWHAFSDELSAENFKKSIVELFADSIENREQSYKLNLDLCRDTTSYSIGPHTDIPNKVLTLIFYLAQDDKRPHFGTSLFTPSNPYFEDPLCGHHPFEKFKLVETMPYRANSMFGFVRSEDSWHGVLPIEDEGAERNTLGYCLSYQ